MEEQLNIDKLTRTDMDMVQAFADNNMVVQKAANESHYTRMTLRYHFDKVHKITGLNPRDFYQLHELIKAINHWKGDAK